MLQNQEGVPSERYRLAVRAMSRCLTDRARGEVTRYPFFEIERTLDNVRSHQVDANEATVNALRNEANMIKLKMDRAYRTDVKADELLDLLFKIKVSAFIIYDSNAPRVVRLGSGLYLGASRMEHTCEAIEKYVLHFDGPNLIITALCDFTVDDALEIRRNFVSPNFTLTKRRQELSFKYYLRCGCPRCALEERAEARNLPLGLEEFANLPDANMVRNWERKARDYFELVRHHDDHDFYRYSLAYKLQFLCSGKSDVPSAIRYGIEALGGALVFEENKQIRCMLAKDMVKYESSDSDNKVSENFLSLLNFNVELFSTVFTPSHRLVKDSQRTIARLRSAAQRAQNVPEGAEPDAAARDSDSSDDDEDEQSDVEDDSSND